MHNLKYELYHKQYGKLRFGTIFRMHPHKNSSWADIAHWQGHDVREFRNLIIKQLSGFKKSVLEKQPDPGIEQALAIREELEKIYGPQPIGKSKNMEHWVSWKTAYAGYILEYYPHKLKEIHETFTVPLKDLWRKAFEDAKQYRLLAVNQASVEELNKARDACFGTAAQIAKKAKTIFAKDVRPYGELNRIVLSRVMRDTSSKMYGLWVNSMVEGMKPLIKQLIKDQFKAGIIVEKGGVNAAMEKFTEEILPLLRRDFMQLLPKAKFHTGIFAVICPYKSEITSQKGPPSKKQIKADDKKLKDMLKNTSLQGYETARYKVIEGEFRNSVLRAKEAILEEILSGDLLLKRMAAFVEGVDYSDEMLQKLNARKRAKEGRGQDLARLTESGVPDTSAPLVALMLGASKGGGVSVKPVQAYMNPAYYANAFPERVVYGTESKYPPKPGKWGFEAQAEIKPPFKDSANFEGIPFVSKFPRLDGILKDWGDIRPLVLRNPQNSKEVNILYAAWNYQGFFFGYNVTLPSMKDYHYVSQYSMSWNRQIMSGKTVKKGGVGWAFKGDYLRLLFDTLDARHENRGEPHTQEFLIFPRGTDSDRHMPGIERVFASEREAKTKEYRGVVAKAKVFPSQPLPEQGPDGSGPFRVTRCSDTGYTTEVFIPRSLFSVPVFAPGWYIGFDAMIAKGYQSKHGNGYVWGKARDASYGDRGGLHPKNWGDVLLLGTDPYFSIQHASDDYPQARAIMPGHSYLLTVIDPDRNVHIKSKDTVLVSAEVVVGGTGCRDMEVFILKETKENNGIFRGFIDTQPGVKNEVLGVLEMESGDEVRFGYVDFANAKGMRNAINEIRLPVVHALMSVVTKKEGN
jgi:hypothetical protein